MSTSKLFRPTPKSSLPSALKSAMTTDRRLPSDKFVLLKLIDVEGIVTEKKVGFEVTLVPGFVTVIVAVLELAISDARMAAVNCDLDTKVVALGPPFQFT